MECRCSPPARWPAVLHARPDYIGKLCREGKLECTREGNAWFVSEHSIHAFERTRQSARVERSKELAAQRRTEQEVYRKAAGLPAPKSLERAPQAFTTLGRYISTVHGRGTAVALGALLLVVATAFAGVTVAPHGSNLGSAQHSDLTATLAQVPSPFFSALGTTLSFEKPAEGSVRLFSRIAAFFFGTPEPKYAVVPPVIATPPVLPPPTATNQTTVIERTTLAGDYIPTNALTLILSELHRSLRAEIIRIVSKSYSNMGGGGDLSLSDLTDANIPDSLTVSGYLPLAGGTLSGALDNSSSATSTFTGGIALERLNTLSTSTLAGITLTNIDCSGFGNSGKLTTDADGNLICAGDISGSGSGTPGGSSGDVQYNDGAGGFAAEAAFDYNAAADRLTLSFASTTGVTVSGTASTTNLNISGLGNTGTAVLVSNNQGAVSATAAGTNGQVLALVGGTPTWQATTTFSTGLTYASSNVTCNTANSGTFGCLSSTDWSTFNNKISSTSLSGTSVISYTPSSGVITTTGGIFGAGNYTFPGELTVTSSTTLQNFTFANATGTQATTTNFFTTTFGIGSDSISDLTGTGLTVSNGALTVTTTTLGLIGENFRDWRIVNGALSPTTTLGIVVSASSTIGAGGQATGLTISGGATTTGFLKVLGSASSTFSSGINVFAINQTGSATSTFTNGIDLADGCFAVDGVCLSSSGVLSIQQTYGTAQTGAITLATTTAVSFNGLTLGNTITNSSGTFTLANTLAGTLTTAGGGTGLQSVADGSLLFGSGSTALSALATTSGAGRFLTLDYTTGRPSWVSTSTLGFIGELFRDWQITNGALSPTTTLGILVSASSTIGDGTQTGGLTISGGATTTGNALFDLGAIASSTFVVGANSYTNPAFQIFASTTNAATGLALKSNVAGGGTILQTTSSGANESLTLASKGTGGWQFLGTANGSTLSVNATNGANYLTLGQNFAANPWGNANNSLSEFSFSGGNTSGLTASTEVPLFLFAVAQNSHSNGAIALQREFLIRSSRETFTSFSALNNIAHLATLGVEGAPVNNTTSNGTTTNAYSILIGSSTPSIMLTSSTTNSYGLGVFANGGAVNNYAAIFNGGNVGIGTTSPFAPSSIHANNGSTNKTLFAIGSSTASATTTLFSVSNTGSTTLFQLPSSLLKTDSGGTIIAATAGVDYLTAAVTAIGPTGQTADGPTVTLATSSTAYNGLTASTTITGVGDTLTFTNTLAGLLQVGGGGTGLQSVADGSLLFGSGSTALSALATTSGAGRFLTLDYTTGRPSWVSTSTLGFIGELFRDWQITNGALSPTTTLGILVSASSTIGDGTQAGGLTISGGATTTGAFAVTLPGTSTLAFQVNNTAASSGNGLAITTTAAGGGVTIQTVSANANEGLNIFSKGTGGVVIGGVGASGINFTSSGGGSRLAMSAIGTFTHSPLTRATFWTAPFWLLTAPAETSLIASTEIPDVSFNLARSKSHSNGNIVMERNFLITAPTEAFTNFGAGNITDAATLSVTSGPLAGTNATTTNSYAILIGSSTASVMFNASTTNTYGLAVFTSAWRPKHVLGNIQRWQRGYRYHLSVPSTFSREQCNLWRRCLGRLLYCNLNNCLHLPLRFIYRNHCFRYCFYHRPRRFYPRLLGYDLCASKRCRSSLFNWLCLWFWRRCCTLHVGDKLRCHSCSYHLRSLGKEWHLRFLYFTL